MIPPERFFRALKQRGIGMFAGVPDSLLSNFCSCVADHSLATEHLVMANEGNAVALAAGYHLSTGRTAAVYMQNSGLGNAVNPLISLLDREVYRIPVLLIIGWRGEPGVRDEPQHIKQGRITTAQLDVLEIPYWVLDADCDFTAALDGAFGALRQSNASVALLIRKGTFASYISRRDAVHLSPMLREQALGRILSLAESSDLIVATTGKTSREVHELRLKTGEQRDFLTVGGMGHASSIALGVALGNPARRVICLDGDGSMLMHMGALPIIGAMRPRNLIHVLLNNAAHESVGGQPTVAGAIALDSIVKACGYRACAAVEDLDGLTTAWTSHRAHDGPLFLEVRIRTGSRPELGRPTTTPEQNKHAFMKAALA